MLANQIRTPRLEALRLGGLSSVSLPPRTRAIAPPPAHMDRARREHGNTAVEMVTSHVEMLIERVTGVNKAIPDSDGAYPVRFQDALYWVSVTGNGEQPVVRVFSQVVSNLAPRPELYEAVNQVNACLSFCRCFFLADRVIIETEHLGMTIRTEDFRELTQNVAVASASFGSTLIERFGGRLPFATDVDEEDVTAAPTAPTGLYL